MARSGPRRVALVTGASSGIGRAAALGLSRAGYALALVARSADRLEALAGTLEAQGGRARSFPLDLNDEAATQALGGAVEGTLGPVDLLVNCAGHGLAGPLELVGRGDLRSQFEVNCIAALALSGAVAARMRERGGGRIIQISSPAAITDGPFFGAYGASKAALERATDALRVELGPWGIDVVLVLPGFTDNGRLEVPMEPLYRRAPPGLALYRRATDAMRASIAASFRAKARPAEEIARTIVHAATTPRPRSRYITPRGAWLAARLWPWIPSRLTDRFWRRTLLELR